MSVHGGNFHWFQWELCECEIKDFHRYLSLQLVWTVPRLLEITLQAQLASVFISPLFSLLFKKILHDSSHSLPQTQVCEQSAAQLQLWLSVCKISLTTELQSYLCFSTHIKHKFLRSTQNHSKWFSDDECMSSDILELLLLSNIYLQTQRVCFVSECGKSER